MVLRLRTAVLLLLPAASAAAVTSFADVPASPGALNTAVDAISLLGDSSKHLRLAPGRHQLVRPLVLTEAHNGLRMEGSAGSEPSVISGGMEIDPGSWVDFAPAHCAGCGRVMRAPLPAGTNYSRQLYVGGVRANWTMALFPAAGATITATGYSVPASSGLNWTHNGGSGVEMVYRGTKSSGAQWTESRTPATAFVHNALLPGRHKIEMAKAGFLAGRHKAYNQHLALPEYYQNAFELLGDAKSGKPGDFYLDLDKTGKGSVYYVTTASQHATDTHTARSLVAPIHAILPQLELLVHAQPGAADLSWSKVTFAEATWNLPSTDVGFVEMQAGCTLRGTTPPPGHTDWNDDSTWSPTTANVLLVGVSGARFEGCTFTRLGACAVSFEGGAQNNTIANSVFVDISASALSVGRVNSYNISDPNQHDANNKLSDSHISRVAQEFHGAPGVAVFYARGKPCQPVCATNDTHVYLLGFEVSSIDNSYPW